MASAARRLGRTVGVIVVLFALTYGFAAVTDVETNEISDLTRTRVSKEIGGAFNRGRDGYTYYEVAGPDTAPLVVLAAGASVPGYIWQPTFDTLKQAGYHVLRYDYYGRGWSDRPDIELPQEVYVQQLSELLDSLHVTKPITLAGLSFGGSVITSFAAAHPERVSALIYADPALGVPHTVPFYLRQNPVGELVTQAQSRNWAGSQRGDFLHPEKFPDWVSRYEVQTRYKGFRRGRMAAAEASGKADLWRVLMEVGKNPRPVLVIWGKQDKTVPFTVSTLLMSQLPHGKLVAVDSAGHLPHWEQPAVTHAALFEFLRANAAAPASRP